MAKKYPAFKEYVLESGETREEPLAKHFHIRRTTVRDLMSIMIQDGLVEPPVSGNRKRKILVEPKGEFV